MIDDTRSGFNLWKLLVVLAHRRMFIISFVVVSTVVSIGVAFLLPKWYRAKTSILPSQQDQPAGLVGNFVQYTLSSSGFDLPIMATPSDVYATMLKSETIGRAVMAETNLQEYLHLSSPQKCYLYLREKTRISVTGEGVVELYFEDRNPEIAARVANSFISQLDSLNRRLKVAKASADRKFVEERLAATQVSLSGARDQLLAFQIKNKTLDLDRQRDLAIGAAGSLKSQLALTEVSLDVKRKLYSVEHPEIVRLETEVAELKNHLTALERGSGRAGYLELPLDEIPDLTIRFAQLKTAVLIQEKVFELLTNLLEDARIKEQKDTPTISILESAYPPELKYKPKRTLIVVGTCAASLVLAIVLVLIADYLQNLRRISPTDYDLLNRVRRELTGKTGFTDT